MANVRDTPVVDIAVDSDGEHDAADSKHVAFENGTHAFKVAEVLTMAYKPTTPYTFLPIGDALGAMNANLQRVHSAQKQTGGFADRAFTVFMRMMAADLDRKISLDEMIGDRIARHKDAYRTLQSMREELEGLATRYNAAYRATLIDDEMIKCLTVARDITQTVNADAELWRVFDTGDYEDWLKAWQPLFYGADVQDTQLIKVLKRIGDVARPDV